MEPLGVLRMSALPRAGDKHGPNDGRPDGRVHEGGFVEQDKIQAFAAQAVGIMGAAEGDHAAVGKVDAAFSLADPQILQGRDRSFQVAPDLARHFPRRG